MLITSDGYVLTVEEYDIYHNFKPSWLQNIVWFFFPSSDSVKIKIYKNISREDL